MFTTIQEPTELFNALRKQKEAKYLDTNREVVPFLQEQYNYEKGRIPMHEAFKNTYILSYFNASHMLQYYMNPWGKETKEQYMIDEHDVTRYEPVIMKRTLD